MFQSVGSFVSRHAVLIIVMWIVSLVLIRLLTPRWDDVTHDGDLAYLPSQMPSVVGERKLIEAFPDEKSKSQVILVIARDEGEFQHDEEADDEEPVAKDLARIFFNELAVGHLTASRTLSDRINQSHDDQEINNLKTKRLQHWQAAENALKSAIEHDQSVAEHYQLRKAEKLPGGNDPPQRLAEAYFNLALLYQDRDNPVSDEFRQQAIKLDASLSQLPLKPLRKLKIKIPLQNVWTWEHRVFGKELGKNHPHARLIFLQLSTELMAVQNMKIMQAIERQIARVGSRIKRERPPGLMIATSGTAAIGSDMLRSAAESIKNTELWTIILVSVILLVVYRSPLLVCIPLITLGCSVIAASGIIAALTQLNTVPGFEWWDFKIFKTTKIFLMVILFGAGTDYCLFLIARYKEELEAGHEKSIAISRALTGVGNALAASALTTIVGLGMMFFSEFGKYRNSGPALGLSIIVALLACVTLAPALLKIFGNAVFWPLGIGPRNFANKNELSEADANQKNKIPLAIWFWNQVAGAIIARPGLILVIAAGLLLPLAWQGTNVEVTYDFLSELDSSRPSKQGTQLLKKHFRVGESGPIVVLAHLAGQQFEFPKSENETELQRELRFKKIRANADRIVQLANRFRKIEGITVVKSLIEPDGVPLQPDNNKGNPPKKKDSLIQATIAGTMRAHRLTKSFYVTHNPKFNHSILKFVLIPTSDPFALQTTHTLNRVNSELQVIANEESSFWKGTEFTYSGPTAAIADLRVVTQADYVRIKILVTIAVFFILLVILRRPLICVYLILSVLLSYYVTIGATQWFFAYVYGESFHGLDWKVPIFLFVILVAIGEDYNIYLTTRVFEEQNRHGKIEGLRRGVVTTGGIITSCGLIMAGTFLSMTSGTWASMLPDWLSALKTILPAGDANLRAIIELGFALSLGVMLDTLIVRPILVPAFLMFCPQGKEIAK